MRIFVSYARIDRPYCVRIVETLNAHEVWFDARLYAGQGWWNEILRRLDWCEGFVYLLSPDSLASDYCRREFQLAKSLGRHIFPIVIHPDTEIPNGLKDTHYVDISKGLTAENVKSLLDSIYIAENRRFRVSPHDPPGITSEDVKPPTLDMARLVEEVVTSMESGNYDRAVYLLEQAKTKGYKPTFFDLNQLLVEAKNALARMTYLREAEREYREIAPLVRHATTKQLGCTAFQAYQSVYSDFDPDGISQLCAEQLNSANDATTPAPITQTSQVTVVPSTTKTDPPAIQEPSTKKPFNMPLFEWCYVPEGYIQLDNPEDNQVAGKPIFISAFKMAKFPVTNAQFQMFVDDPKGYANPQWWRFSRAAYNWRIENEEPSPSTFQGDERPREQVNWYTALAFCNWLSNQLNESITLPTVEQRQRAIQGDDDRIFPWGDQFDKTRCNTRESELRVSTLVTRFSDGCSPHGIYDLAGNVWEWCLNAKYEEQEDEEGKQEKRAVHGGSFVSPCERAEVGFRYYLNPQIQYASIGFRVVQNLKN
jgi:formylglycine-generating enzyme required for sulfatase activity